MITLIVLLSIFFYVLIGAATIGCVARFHPSAMPRLGSYDQELCIGLMVLLWPIVATALLSYVIFSAIRDK